MLAFNFNRLRTEIEHALDQLSTDIKWAKALILTEDDLKCQVYKRLTELPSLNSLRRTMDPRIYTNMVHAELPWYDGEERLTIRPDITILDSRHLSILHGYCDLKRLQSRRHFKAFSAGTSRLRSRGLPPPSVPALPSKQFEFGGQAIIFELKFVRESVGITEKVLNNKIISDYEKINRLFDILDGRGCRGEVFAYQVIVNKTSQTCPGFLEFLQSNEESTRHKIIYRSVEVRPYNPKWR